MSLITEYRATEEAIKELQDQLEKLSGNEALLKEMEFEEKLQTLMSEYGQNLRDIVTIFDPDYSKKVIPAPTKPRPQRAVKIYRNPSTGVVIETKGGNHKILKGWKQEHGSDVVEGWRTQ